MTGGRRLALRGATLLHVAAEYGLIDAATLLLDRGANIDARATIDADGLGGQTPIFHAVTQFDDFGLPMARLLIDRGANLALQVQIPGDYEQPGEVVVCTPLGYARSFGGPSDRATVAYLRESGAAE
jgi:ankyrin repeat protein